MIRGIAFGALAFGAAFVLERQLGSVLKDIKRYDRLRAMSGDEPLYRDALRQASAFLLHRASRQAPEHAPDASQRSGVAPHGDADTSLLGSLQKDVMRYAVMRSM